MTPKGHLGSKKFSTIRKAIYDFLFDFYGHHLSLWPLKVIQGQQISYHSKFHIWLHIWLLWTGSLYLVPFSKYSTSKFLWFDLDLWPLDVIWGRKIVYHSKGHIWLPIWFLWTPSFYLVTFSRYSTSKFLGFDLDHWPRKIILGSKMFIPFGWPYMISYLTSIFTIFLSHTVLGIFDFKVFRVWPWLLTPKDHLWSNNFIPFERPYIISYLTSMDNISLSLTALEIFGFKVFRVWPWPLTPKGHPRSKKFILFERPYITFYLTSMDAISLSLTVFEIFDFKVFRVWTWTLTPKGHLGSKNFIPFGSPYMTSYLTSMDTMSLSLTVLEIFKYKNSRVWPWPLTPKSHLGSRNFIPFERPYMISYLTSMNTISLSRTVLEIMPVKILNPEQNGGFWPF